ncbi:MAG: HAMP domain-containing sensor histidine kinase [Peptococcaceae bacterium]|nr:HAMP domain-containing sensor histidine kinase [Peptococcaceae bacterium]
MAIKHHLTTLSDRLADPLGRGLFRALIILDLLVLMLSLGAILFASEIAARLILFLMVLCMVATLFCCYCHLSRWQRLVDDATALLRTHPPGTSAVVISSDEEGALYRLFHEVNTLNAALSARIARENDAKIFLQDTLADISHQLKNPLATLNIYNDIIAAEAANNDTISEFCALTNDSLNHIDLLVQNLLYMARLDAGTLPFQMRPENLAELIAELAQRFRPRAQLEGKQLSFSGDEDATLFCDRTWMLEALGNLVKNALDHTASGGHIQVSWKNLGSLVQLTVTDDGAGIHPEDLLHIFKRFYRSQFSQSTQGAGLGLALTKAIVDAHEGTIEVASTLGEGTIFTLHFLIPTKM